MKIFVTGGAGYIGSHMVYKLLSDGHEVAVFDNLVKGHVEILDILSSHFGKNIKFYKGDLLNYDEISNAMSEYKPDAVIHFAAFSEVGESVKDPNKYYKNNICGGLNLINSMRDCDVKYIVFSSTAATFGDPIEVPIKETTPQDPINPYGQSKLVFEKILKDADMAYGIKHVILRYFNACGAQEEGLIGEWHDPESHLIPLIIQTALGKRESITIFGEDYDTPDGTAIRDYVHVLDLADAHIRSVDYLRSNNVSSDFNLGSSSGYSVKEIIEKVKEVTESDFKVIKGDRRAGDPAILIADNQKAKEILNWDINYDLEKIIRSAWKWHSARK